MRDTPVLWIANIQNCFKHRILDKAFWLDSILSGKAFSWWHEFESTYFLKSWRWHVNSIIQPVIYYSWPWPTPAVKIFWERIGSMELRLEGCAHSEDASLGVQSHPSPLLSSSFCDPGRECEAQPLKHRAWIYFQVLPYHKWVVGMQQQIHVSSSSVSLSILSQFLFCTWQRLTQHEAR